MDSMQGAKFYQGSHHKVGIILLHAYTGSPMDVNLLANRLKREGYNVLSPLFDGHGSRDIYDLFQGNLEVWKEQTRTAIAWMHERHYEHLFIFGLSMGGLLATWALCQRDFPLIAGGIFNSPVMTQAPIDIELTFDQFAQSLYQSQTGADYAAVRQDILFSHRQQLASIEAFKQELAADLQNLQRPYFIGQSLQDELIDPADAKILAQSLPDSLVSYHEYPNNSHVITVNPDRADFETDLLNFIRQSLLIKKGGNHEFV